MSLRHRYKHSGTELVLMAVLTYIAVVYGSLQFGLLGQTHVDARQWIFNLFLCRVQVIKGEVGAGTEARTTLR